MTKILLLDIDGVLIQPKGYRAAIRAVIRTIGKFMGIDCLEVSDTILARFEAQGITSEFDMVPLLIGALWDDLLRENPPPNLSSDVLEAASQIGEISSKSLSPGWQLGAQSIAPPFIPLKPYQFPAETAYHEGIYPHLPQALRRNLLLHTRDPHLSTTTRLFQEYVLGTERFCRTYHLESMVQTESFLEKYDRPLLTPQGQAFLRSISLQKDVHLCVMTSRPSLPPIEVKDIDGDYSAESEIALQKVGLENIPIIGLGKIQYVAKQHDVKPERLLKPSAGHSLAAMVAALEGNELLAVQSAVKWQQGGILDEIAKIIPNELELHIVEDTLSGIHSARAATEILNSNGHSVTLLPWGLTNDQPEKIASFEKEGIPCFSKWKDLIAELQKWFS
jgi:hypothetical protein